MTRSAPSVRVCTTLAVVSYLLISLWAYRELLPDPSGRLVTAVSEGPAAKICRWDQSAAVASIARHAHVLLNEPSQLQGHDQCFPLPQSQTLGEHMFGSGLLAAIPYALTGDPILSYNVLLIVSVWIAGIAMYAFSYHYVRDPIAAFVAGLSFALTLSRVFDAAHPFAYADMWTPLAMLFLHRLFAAGGVGNAVAFAFFAGLIVLQSLYPLVSGTILLAFYSVHLARTYRRELVARIPVFALALALLAIPSVFVLAPYLATRETWNLLSNRVSVPRPLPEGWLLNAASLLAIVGTLDRLRGPRARAGSDPRLCFFLSAAFLLWAASLAIFIPGTNLFIPSPIWLLRVLIPGADAVRGLNSIGSAVDLPLSFLAGYGVHVLIERTSRRVAVAVASAIALWIGAERLYPPVSAWVWGLGPTLTPWEARPADEDIALLRKTEGPILDLPHTPDANIKSWVQADHLRFTSFDSRPSSSCYASFPSPIDGAIVPLAKQMPDPEAADALYALGFRTVLMHVPDAWPPELKRFERELAAKPGSRARLQEIGRTSRLIAYRLKSPVEASSDLAPLAQGASPVQPVRAAPGATQLDVTITNTGVTTFVHPTPIAPTDVVVRWNDPSGAAVAEERTRFLLPLALGRKASQATTLATTIPATPGFYSVTVALGSRPDLVIARLQVHVDPTAPPPPKPRAPGFSVKPDAGLGPQTTS